MFTWRHDTIRSTPKNRGGNDVTINRTQVGAGWFLTPNILLKGEYVNQDYKDFPNTSRFFEGKFNGIVIEAVVGF